MILLFAGTLFLSSTLLFLVQPMIAKMVLPLLGGTPAVWNTCMVFFQAMLLLGYLYVHAVTRWLRLGQQALLHVTLLGLSLLALPIVIGAHDAPPSSAMPIFWLARLLLVTVGVPFFVVSTSGPMLPRWFARTDHPAAVDPYFLSVAGNLGSIAALLAYPAGLEPRLRLAEQSGLWAAGYGGFVLMMGVCAWVARSKAGPSPSPAARSEHERPALHQRLRWIGLAFVPSSLMLGLTTYLTTDVAPVPLFWVVPLSLYLLSFVLVFARRVVVPHQLMLRLLPVLALVLVTLIVFASALPMPIQAPVHLATFFVAAMVCHGELARSRPTSGELTDFYLMMSVGGVLGGLFNALVAPLAFKTVIEYPLAIVLACVARPAPVGKARPDGARDRVARVLDVASPIALGLLAFGLMSALGRRNLRDPVVLVLLYGLPSFMCFSFKRRPVRFALGLGALLLAGGVYLRTHQPVAFSGRSYFSVYKVVTDQNRHLRMLVHGRILHGAQSLDAARRGEPLTYFDRSGPIGQAFATFSERFAKRRIGVIGLGAGSLAAYAQPGQRWTFYEIDPGIAKLANDPRYFTFLRDARSDIRIVLGDARLSLVNEPSCSFDLLIVDAFGSDAIPVHLLTREALQLYSRILDQHGVLAFHITNGYVDLHPLLGDLARDAGLAAIAEDDHKIRDVEKVAGKTPSSWVLMARSRDDLGPLASDDRWHPQNPRSTPIVWTDDFSNPLSVMRWF